MKLGEKQTLTVVKQVDFGVYLAEQPEDETRVLLPAKQVPEGTKLHDKLEVFLYKDSKDRLIATTNEPKLTLGGFAVLKVLQVTKIGAFLDWGLEKDLLLPFKEQLRKVHEGDEVLVTLYIDKSNRLCAPMEGIYHLLSTDSPYKKGDTVTGRVYEFSENFGTFVAVDDKYSARIPGFENTTTLKIVALGLIAFMFGTAAGVLFGKLLCFLTKGKINPLIGSAGVSAVPMAARVSQKVGAEEDPTNFLLMHAMGPNVAGVIGTAVAAGVFMAIFGI